MKPHDATTDELCAERAALYRKNNPAFAHWAAGYGVIEHSDVTQVRVFELGSHLHAIKAVASPEEVFRCLAAADRVTCAAMWLVVHATYARNVHLDGRTMEADDFRSHPEGHTGGALNIVPAYVGYLAANTLLGLTRSWMMGQGHCVAAIDATNVLAGNATRAQTERYPIDDEGLTRFVRDFYSYEIRPDGRPASPLGSHVNPHTGGGMLEGGYLGFAELQYVHVPLKDERLVAFLSDGAFEEQRGSDWAPRWWRAEDSGLVCPILIANGRRIDQRTTVAQQGGVEWLHGHLTNNGFDPIEIDGRDPAAYAWAVHEMEERLQAAGRAVAQGQASYPVRLPYAIAETTKGFGFPGAGTNLAHNLPLGAHPGQDEAARQKFNHGARALWVPPHELAEATAVLNNHARNGRVRERDHSCLTRPVPDVRLPEPPWRSPGGADASAMVAIDEHFVNVVDANPALRVRLGNPDELRSNGMNAALDHLKHRVTAPEPAVAEAVTGSVVTALNEEAVVCAALGNKGGLNLVVTYEAFSPKMLGAIRQEVIFARHQRELGQTPRWHSVPLLLTSHTWENGKNEQSHQDPTMPEALLGEMGDGARVLFPGDANSAMAVIEAAYGTRGQIWTAVVAKRPLPVRFSGAQARALVQQGALRVRGSGDDPGEVLLAAIGAYQLQETLRASKRLEDRGVPHTVVYIQEPGRFRRPRDRREAAVTSSPQDIEALFPARSWCRVFLTHTRPEPLMGVMRPLDTGAGKTEALGYINRGGTLDPFGMLFANRCTWAHVIAAVAAQTHRQPTDLLTPQELAALAGEGDPRVLD